MIFIYYILISNLFSVEYESMVTEFDKLHLDIIRNIEESEGSIYINSFDEIYKYNAGNLIKIEISGYDSYFDNFNILGMEVDNNNHIIINNLEGVGFYNNQSWQYYSAKKYPELNYNGQFHFCDDTLFLKTSAAMRFTKFLYNPIKNNYEMLDSLKEYYDKGQRFLTQGIWNFDEEKNIICVSLVERDLLRIDVKTEEVTNLSKLYNIKSDSITNISQIECRNGKIYFATANKDTTVSFYVLNEDLSKDEYTFKNVNFINLLPEGFTYTLYKEYCILSSGYSQLYVINFKTKKTILLDPPKQLEKSNFSKEWYVTSLHIDDKDTLWIGTFNTGIFKTHINNLTSLLVTDVEKEVSNYLNLYPNPASSEISIKFDDIGKKEIQIFNLNLQKIYEFETNEKNVNIDISKYEVGTYIVKSKLNNKTLWNKFIKN